MGNTENTQVTSSVTSSRKSVDVRAGIAFSLTFLATAIILYFRPGYFGFATSWISVACVIFGLMTLGLELNRLAEELQKSSIQSKKGSDIFNNLGIGAGLLLLWVVLHINISSVFINVVLFVVLFMGVASMLWGLMNLIFEIALRRKELEEQRINIEAPPDKRDALIDLNDNRYYNFVKNAVLLLGFFIGLLSGIATILQWLEVKPWWIT